MVSLFYVKLHSNQLLLIRVLEFIFLTQYLKSNIQSIIFEHFFLFTSTDATESESANSRENERPDGDSRVR